MQLQLDFKIFFSKVETDIQLISALFNYTSSVASVIESFKLRHKTSDAFYPLKIQLTEQLSVAVIF
jgi:hypothetical protein